MDKLNRSHFESTEQLEEALRRVFEVEITRSRAGPLSVDLTADRVGDCLIYESSTSQPLLCSGARAEDVWTISPMTRSSIGGRCRGMELKEGNLLVLDPGGEVYQQVAAGQRQQAISIPCELAERIAQVEYGTTGEDLWGKWRLKSDRRVTRQISSILDQYLSTARRNHLDAPSQLDLASTIISLAQEAQDIRQIRPSLAHRRRIVSTAEELIRSRLVNPPSVTELCELTHTSRRLLFYAFRELLGRTPSAHIKILRLNAARLNIVVRSNERCVQQIAVELGFSHLGQFAIDYAKLFGESPNKTRMRHNEKAYLHGQTSENRGERQLTRSPTNI